MNRFLFLLLFLQACTASNPHTHLKIATAANVQFAMQELVDSFTVETGIECNIIIGSSGKLTAQISEGAPYDVFVSANMKYPNALYNGGYTVQQPEIYALGKLVLWTIIDSPLIQLNWLQSTDFKHVAIPNPKNAPYGEAALQVLENLGIKEIVEPKLVFGESIAQTNQFVLSKSANIGFTSKSVVLSEQMRTIGQWLDLPEGAYQPIEQGVVIIKRKNAKLEKAQLFYDFLFSPKAQAILLRNGYQTPKTPR